MKIKIQVHIKKKEGENGEGRGNNIKNDFFYSSVPQEFWRRTLFSLLRFCLVLFVFPACF
jgi:hypothetical protein